MDGIHVNVRLGEDPKVCLLIVIGVREDGEKELLAVEDGYRESSESWAGVFRRHEAPRPERAQARGR
jgi:putative transposase